MTRFTISRIHTQLGIFRVSGSWCGQCTVSSKLTISSKLTPSGELTITSLEVMGTDGWVELNQTTPQVSNMLETLNPLLVAHLSDSS